MTYFIIIITVSILLAWPKITFCNIVLLLITTGVVSLNGLTGGPDFFLWLYAFFALVVFYDGYSKRNKEVGARQEKITQAELAKAMLDSKKRKK